MSVVHVVMPEGVDDPSRPSGGNAYDRRACGGLAELGWTVREHAVAGAWPWPDQRAAAALDSVLGALPRGAAVLVDGLIASCAPEALRRAADRLHVVVLVHMPLAGSLELPTGAAQSRMHTTERAALSAAAAIVTTSTWTRRWLVERYGLTPGRVHVAEPGVDPAGLAPGTDSGGELLCVAAVVPHKGHDILLEALERLVDLPWRCRCVGSLERDPGFVDRLTRRAREAGIGGRVLFTGPAAGADLDRMYDRADLLVVASRSESYGMVVSEALARGLPVLASTAGGLPEALGDAGDGTRPGLLVAPGDPAALAAALRRWLRDSGLRERLRVAARRRRLTLTRWPQTSGRIAAVLAEVAR